MCFKTLSHNQAVSVKTYVVGLPKYIPGVGVCALCVME